MPQVDFYVLQSAEYAARLQFCARLCEKALHNNVKVFALTRNHDESAQLSETLWQFRADAFLPHSTGAVVDEPIAINHSLLNPWANTTAACLLINLTESVPAEHTQFARIAEVVIQSPAVLAATRAHFILYKQRGYAPNSHKV